MTLSFRSRDRARDGVRRRVTESQPVPGTLGATFAERAVATVSSVLSGRQSRRRFLARTAVVGSALAVNPMGYILRPGTAYAALCGTCNDGWTAFCCTVNGGRNSCPPNSFVAGWWKADNAAFCCGKARYIIDCNATCPTQCSCRCSGASCDGRKTCCNQFRYGQCNQQIACYGPVACRVAICTPAWQYDPSCTTASATDNRTVTHGAPCLPDECTSAITKLYAQLGGASGVLGAVTTSERATADRTGRYAHYQKGSIFQRTGKAPYEVHDAIADRYEAMSYHRSDLGYPVTNQTAVGDGVGVFNRFDGGVIYSGPGGTREVMGAIRDTHSSTGGVRGPLKYPTSYTKVTPDNFGRSQDFQGGLIVFAFGTGARWLTGAIRQRWLDLGGVTSPLGYPTSSHTGVGGGALTRFQRGTIYSKSGVGTFQLTGPIHGKYRGAIGEVTGALGWPKSNVGAISGGSRALFEKGGIYLKGSRVHEVHGGINNVWLANGGVTGALGWPVTDVTTISDRKGRRSGFDKGMVIQMPGTGTWGIWGPIATRYTQLGEATGSLGYPETSVYADGDLFRCDFANGRLTYDPDAGTVTQD